MHSHINSAKSFSRCIKYIFGKPRAQFIAKNYLIGSEPSEWISELKYVAAVSTRLKKPVLHINFSPHPEEELCHNSKKATEFIKDYLDRMGWSECQWVLGKHFDTETPHGQERPHYHLVLNRISLGQRTAVSRSWCGPRSQEILRQLRKKYGLREVREPSEIERKPNTVGQERRYRKEQLDYLTGDRTSPPEIPIRQQLQEIIDGETSDYPTLALLQSRLEKIGVETRITPTDKGQGISYSYQGVAFRGISLGRGYTISGLKRYGKIQTETENPYNSDSDDNDNGKGSWDTTAKDANLALARLQDADKSKIWHPQKQELSLETSSNGEMKPGVDRQDSQVFLDMQNLQQQQDMERLQTIVKQQRSQSLKPRRPLSTQLEL